MAKQQAETVAQMLRALIAKATKDDLADGGRYFAESCVDLTRCTHGDMGRYDDPADGELIEWLWNHRNVIADRFADTGKPIDAAQERETEFLNAIHQRTPSGAWIAVQHHPDGDWSVAERPLPWLPGGEVAVPETGEAELQPDIDSPAARVEYARLCFTAILEKPDNAKALARAGLDLCDLTASQRAKMRGDA